MLYSRFRGHFLAFVLLAADGAAGAAPAGAAAGAAPAGSAAAAAGAAPAAPAGAAAAAGSAYRPDGLGDEFAGATDRETIDKLYGAYKGATTPGEAGDYVVKWDGEHKDALTGAFGNADDPLYSAARDAARKHGIPPKAFSGFLHDVFGPAFKNGVLPAPFSAKREVEAWGQSIGITDPAELTKQLTERQTWATGLGKQLGLSDKGQVELDVLTDTAGGLELIDKLQGLLNGDGIKVGGAAPSGVADTPDTLRAAMRDERYDSSSKKYDAAYRKSVDERYQRHYG